MTNNISILTFENDMFGTIRVVNNNNGEPWFVGKDVACMLGYTNPQKSVRDHVDEDDKTVNVSFTVNGTTPVLINESGLYSLILSSKLPQAREFKHWVTSVVLPQIRQTGGYIPIGDVSSSKFQVQGSNGSSGSSDEEILSRALMIAQRTIDLKDALIEAQKPKVLFADAVARSRDSILIRDLAKMITQNGVPIGQSRLFYWMRLKGYLFQRESRPIQKWVEKGLFETVVRVYEANGRVRTRLVTRVTGRGQQYFIDGFLTGRFKAGNAEWK